MSKVIVLSTGGTIATRRDGQGVGLAQDRAGELLGRLPVDPGVELVGRDVLCAGSDLFTLADMREVALRTREALTDPAVLRRRRHPRDRRHGGDGLPRRSVP